MFTARATRNRRVFTRSGSKTEARVSAPGEEHGVAQIHVCTFCPTEELVPALAMTNGLSREKAPQRACTRYPSDGRTNECISANSPAQQ